MDGRHIHVYDCNEVFPCFSNVYFGLIVAAAVLVLILCLYLYIKSKKKKSRNKDEYQLQESLNKSNNSGKKKQRIIHNN